MNFLVPETKICSTCQQPKALDRFRPRLVRGQMWDDPQCKDCKYLCRKTWCQKYRDKANQQSRDWKRNNKDKTRNTWLKSNYGITLEEFNMMLLEQNNCCKICETEFTSKRFEYLDHCHETKRVRGILCHHCNTGLGMFKDTKELLLKAMVYLT